ncbi:hypothetical protein ABFY09_10835 [Marinomonas sp. 5E14-1]|uniref:hypothetical protein n=1 Tax=Marinomonas sp. 5E14-1 TaxID=3153922 RepID=UPI00326664E6
MTAFIVIFITLSLMGSALWVLPSKKERHRMDLRMQARKLGLIVQLTSIELPDKWDKSKERCKVVAYSFYRVKALTSLPKVIWLLPYEVWKYQAVGDGWWSSDNIVLTVTSIKTLEKYGAILKAIEITPESVSLYWNEAADKEGLEELAKMIFSLTDISSVLNK